MRTRVILLYWLLLLMPTVFLSFGAFQLLKREKARMGEEIARSVSDRTQIMAQGLRLAVSQVESELMKTLGNVAARHAVSAAADASISPELVFSLEAWEESDPLVRNVFLWKPRMGVVWPPTGRGVPFEELDFVRRYGTLFSGRMSWEDASAQEMAPESGGAGREGPRPDGPAQGWIPWFEENQLFILGWRELSPGGAVTGLEMELMGLLARLLPTLSIEGAGDNGVFTLLDGNGQVLHQVGAGPMDPPSASDALAAVSLAPQLPHWQVCGDVTDPGGARSSADSLFLLGSLLLGIFLVAILSGGSLLTWQAYRQMKEARQKTSFVSNVSHELKTPLTTIRMYSELLAEGRIKEPEKRRQYLDVIVAESQRLARLVNNVLDFSRIDQGRKQYHRVEMDLAEALTSLLEAHRLRIEGAGLAVRVEIPPGPVRVLADQDAVEQALLNLIDNAVKYAAQGKDLSLALSVTAGRCEIRVMDRGPGVPAGHRERIFDRFHRVDDSLTATTQGCGLGLTLARKLLRDMGGDLRYEDRVDGGSAFVFILPLAREGPPVSHTERSTDEKEDV